MHHQKRQLQRIFAQHQSAFSFLILTCGLWTTMSISPAWAKQQTLNYITLYGTPKYNQAPVMPYANAQAPKGGVLIRAGKGTFDNLNSMNGQGTSADGVNYLFDTLMSSSLDEPGVKYPLLAEKVSYDPDAPGDIIFHLNPSARFSNGSEVTAQDVKFTFDSYQHKANLGLQMYLSDLAKTEVISKYAVKMTFKTAHNAEMPMIVSGLPIYAQADWQKKDFSKVTIQPILGSGPYLIEHIDAGRSISYKRNPNYWGRDLPVNRGRYNFDRLKYVYYRNPAVAFEGFKAGQYTLHEEQDAKNWVTQYQFPAMTAGLMRKYQYQLATPSMTRSIVFNTRRAPLQDIHFRQALHYAYDFEWMNKALFYGQYQRLQSYFQNSELAATGRPSADEMRMLQPYLKQLDAVQRAGVLSDWKAPVTDGSGFNRQGLLKARQILLNAGYRYQKGVLVDSSARPINIELLINPNTEQRSLMPYVRNLKKLGIQFTVRQVDESQYQERKRKMDFDLITEEMPQSLTPGKEQMQMWGSQAATQAGNYNYAGIRSAVIDDAIQQLNAAKDRSTLILRTRVLDRLLRAGYYQILTYHQPKQWLAYWNMYQRPARVPQLSAGLEYWWVDPVQAQRIRQYSSSP